MTINSLAMLESNLLAAQLEHLDALRGLNEARAACARTETRLNEAQRALDDRLADMRKEAPRGTVWNLPPSFPADGGDR